MTKNLFIDAFHAHLDECQQCRDNPTNLCETGAILLQMTPLDTKRARRRDGGR